VHSPVKNKLFHIIFPIPAGQFEDCCVLVFMRVGSGQICMAGSTLAPDSDWMKQMARNLTMAGEGMLHGCRYLLQDRDARISTAFVDIF